MTVEILQAFQDIHTGVIYAVGSHQDFTPGRVAEIHQNLPGFVKEIEDSPEEAAEKPKKMVGRKSKVADDEPAVE